MSRAGCCAKAALGALAIAALAATGCPSETQQAPAQKRRAVTDPTAEDYPVPANPRGQVILPTAFGGKAVVDAEIVASNPLRNRGLMWRRELAPGKGMLFIFPTDDEHSFWMKNTFIALDMLFLAADGTVVGILPNVPPHTLSSRTVGKPSRMVLEVPGGWTEKMGVRAGVKAELLLPRIEVED